MGFREDGGKRTTKDPGQEKPKKRVMGAEQEGFAGKNGHCQKTPLHLRKGDGRKLGGNSFAW